MATVDELKILITAETKALRKGLDDVNKKLATTQTQTKRTTTAFRGMGKVVGAIGFGLLGREIIQTSRTFEDLEATLRAVTGGAENAAVSMDLVREFTSGTTFQLENVASAFTTLVNAGIAPTSKVLTDFGNLAAGSGKDITQLAQAVFNATTGEFEMLKQFGIKATVEGDKLAVNFRGNTELIGRDADSIVEHLRQISQEAFSTALEERLKTVSGVFSNFKDEVSEVFKAIGEGGLNDVLVDLGKSLIAVLQALRPVGTFIGGVLKVAFEGLSAVLGFLQRQMNTFIAILGIYAAFKAPALATVLFTNAMIGLTKAIGLARAAMALLSKSPLMVVLTVATLGIGLFTDKVDELAETIKNKLGSLADKLFPKDEKDPKKEIEELDAEIEAFMSKLVTDLPKASEQTVTALGEMKDAVIQSSNAFTTDFVNSLLEGESALESFKNFSKNIVSQIISIFLQMAVVNKILNQVFNLTGANALPTINFGGTTATGTGGGTQGSTAFSNPMGMNAGGGTVQRGTPTIVGERGAEIFVPNTGGTIMNNMNSKNAMGGGSPIIVNQSVNFSTGVVPTVRAEVQKLLPQISDVTKGAVLEAAVRGGSYRKGLMGRG
jgi:hypothetical protein